MIFRDKTWSVDKIESLLSTRVVCNLLLRISYVVSCGVNSSTT